MELAELSHLALVGAVVVRAGNLHHRGQLLERRMREEGAVVIDFALADAANADTGCGCCGSCG